MPRRSKRRKPPNKASNDQHRGALVVTSERVDARAANVRMAISALGRFPPADVDLQLIILAGGLVIVDRCVMRSIQCTQLILDSLDVVIAGVLPTLFRDILPFLGRLRVSPLPLSGSPSTARPAH